MRQGLRIAIFVTSLFASTYSVTWSFAQQKPASSAAVAAAKEILAMKNARAMYANAVPNVIQRTKAELAKEFPSYQKDLDEAAAAVAKIFAGREGEIDDGMAQTYANNFSEQELKDLVAFYKSALGQKLLSAEPLSIQQSMIFINAWAQNFAESVKSQFRMEMAKRRKPI